MENRVPTKPGRIKLTDDSGNIKYYTMERADEPTTEGTPLNKATLFSSTNEELYQCSVPSEAFDKLAELVEIHLPVNGWSSERDENGYFYQRVDVIDMIAQRTPIVSLKVTSTESQAKEEYCYGYIKKVETYNGYIICRIVNMIDTDLTIELKGV